MKFVEYLTRVKSFVFSIALICLVPALLNLFIDLPALLAWGVLWGIGLWTFALWIVFAFMEGVTRAGGQQ